MIASVRLAATPPRIDAHRSLDPLGICCVVFICLAPADGQIFGVESLERYLWLLADAVTIAFLLIRRERLLLHISENWPLLAWPAIAIGSAAWSLTPGISFYHGLQLLMTVLGGYVLRAAFGLRAVIMLVFWALLLSALLSLGAVTLTPKLALGTGNEWLGIYPHKNVLGSMMGLLMLCAACLFLDGWHRTLTLTSFLGALALLYVSKSATALCAAAIGFVPLVALMAAQRSKNLAGILFGLSVILGVIACGLAINHGGQIITGFLADLGKDETLTGRTILWQFGMDQFLRDPWLGVGYKAYWESSSTTAAYMIFIIKQKLWFFHNNFLDIAVAFGVAGLSLFILGFLSCFKRVTVAFACFPTFITAWPICFCIYTLVLACFENVLFQNHSLHQLLLAAAMPAGALAADPKTFAESRYPLVHSVGAI